MIIDYRSFIDALKLVNDFISLLAGGREFQREMVEGNKEFWKEVVQQGGVIKLLGWWERIE